MFYKKKETRIKHDKAREKHIAEIEKMESEYARTLDAKLGKEIQLYYKQLELYDEVMEYV